MQAKSPTKTPLKIFIADVDGVMTDGKFYYTNEGKVMKVFGADDHDALCLLKPYMQILFVTGDHRGFDISKKRIVDDMKMPLELVSATQRLSWIRERFKLEEVLYMGDGIFDHYVMREVGYAIATANADSNTKKVANFVTKRMGGDRAVSEACLHILKKFFVAYRPENQLPQTKFSGTWGV